jgi:hypothetical protein
MKLRKIISGGQTGADQAGLVCAKAMGLEVGGTAPKLFRTEKGSNLALKEYGLVASPHYDFAPRTRQNVLDADCTLWFGNIGSPGYWCTSRAIEQYSKPFEINPSPKRMCELAELYEVINVAGNRYSKNPEVISLVVIAFQGIGLVNTVEEIEAKLL